MWIECSNCGGKHHDISGLNPNDRRCETNIRYRAKRLDFLLTKRTDSLGFMLVDDQDMIVLGENYDATLKEIDNYLRDPGLDQWLANHR